MSSMLETGDLNTPFIGSVVEMAVVDGEPYMILFMRDGSMMQMRFEEITELPSKLR